MKFVIKVRTRGRCRFAAMAVLGAVAFAVSATAEPLTSVGVTVSLSAEEKRTFDAAAETEGSEMFPTVEYSEKAGEGGLQLTPILRITQGVEADQRKFDYLALLKKGGPIEALWQGGAAEFTFMFPSLDVRVINNSQRKLLFTEVMVNVISSESDPTPLVALAETADYFTFNVLNEGWTPLESCSLKFSLGPQPWKRDPTPQFQKDVGKVTRSASVNVSNELVQAGLSRRWLDRVAEFRRKNVDGEPDESLMKPFSSTAYLAGVLSYAWRDQSGALKNHSVRFRVSVPLWVGPEGGPAPIGGRYEAMLRADGHDYAVRIPVSQNVEPGRTSRMLVRLGVPRTSQHRFNLQLRTTRGETIESQPILLTALLPPAAAEQLKKDAASPKKKPRP